MRGIASDLVALIIFFALVGGVPLLIGGVVALLSSSHQGECNDEAW